MSLENTLTPEHERLTQVSARSLDPLVAGMDGVLDALFSAASPPTSVSLLVEPATVGSLIGKGGAVIKEIRTTSGASVTIHDDSIRILHTYARCDVGGAPDAIRAATRKVSVLGLGLGLER